MDKWSQTLSRVKGVDLVSHWLNRLLFSCCVRQVVCQTLFEKKMLVKLCVKFKCVIRWENFVVTMHYLSIYQEVSVKTYHLILYIVTFISLCQIQFQLYSLMRVFFTFFKSEGKCSCFHFSDHIPYLKVLHFPLGKMIILEIGICISKYFCL